jgi:hypothetical protein
MTITVIRHTTAENSSKDVINTILDGVRAISRETTKRCQKARKARVTFIFNYSCFESSSLPRLDFVVKAASGITAPLGGGGGVA